MVQIEPISIWSNGQTKTASILDAYGIRTTLGSDATFYYSLMVQNEDGSLGEQVAQGNLDMTGEDYQQWGADDDYAWQWVASKLNVVILAPTTTETTTINV